jgi:hypothetical protein
VTAHFAQMVLIAQTEIFPGSISGQILHVQKFFLLSRVVKKDFEEARQKGRV